MKVKYVRFQVYQKLGVINNQAKQVLENFMVLKTFDKKC